MQKSSGGPLSRANRKWLSEVRACDKSGESLSSYAERKGVSVHALYQAKKRARELGLFPVHRKQKAVASSPRRSRSTRFVEAIGRVEAREPVVAWRVRFPGGVLFESVAPLSTDDVLQLVDSLKQPS
jgi:hypothetical protein